MEKYQNQNNEDFGELFFNYAIVLHAKLSDIQRIKKLLENDPNITIRYQTLDRCKLLIQREGMQ